MKLKPNSRASGLALIMVLIVVLAFGILAAGFTFSMKIETRLASNTIRDPDMDWLGRSGVELARFVLAERLMPPEDRYDALNQMWAGGPMGTNEILATISLENVRLGDGEITVRIEDLERKMNINVVREDVLNLALLEVLGVDPLSTSVIVDSVQDWIDLDPDPRLNGTDGETYIAQPNTPYPPYLTKNGPIDDISELLLVRGVTPGIFYGGGGGPATGLRDLFRTIGEYRININTAPTQVLQLIPGLDPNLAMAIQQTRAGFDGVDGTEDDMPFMNVRDLMSVPGMPPELMSILGQYCNVKSRTFEIIVEARLDEYRKTYRALVARMSPREITVLNLSWQ